MQMPYFYNSPPAVKLLLSVIIIISGFVFFYFLSVLFAIPLFGLSLNEVLIWYSGDLPAKNVDVMRYFQVVQSVGMFLIPPFIIAALISKNSWKYLMINKKPLLTSVLFVVLSIIIAVPLIDFLARINAGMDLPEFLSGVEEGMKELEESAKNITERFLSDLSLPGFILNIIIIGVLPAIGEELVFRGIFQRLFTDWTRNAHIGILLSAFFFSAIHFQFYGFLPRFFLGVYFGYLLFWSRSLWIPVIAHFINNFAAIVYYFYYHKQEIPEDIEETGQSTDSAYLLITSVVIFIVFTLLIYYSERSKKEG